MVSSDNFFFFLLLLLDYLSIVIYIEVTLSLLILYLSDHGQINVIPTQAPNTYSELLLKSLGAYKLYKNYFR